MANIGCLLMYAFGNFLAPVLVVLYKVNNLDLGDEKRLKVEGCESD